MNILSACCRGFALLSGSVIASPITLGFPADGLYPKGFKYAIRAFNWAKVKVLSFFLFTRLLKVDSFTPATLASVLNLWSALFAII